MKKKLTTMIIVFLAITIGAQATPAEIPFGPATRFVALSQVSKVSYEVSIRPDGERIVIAEEEYNDLDSFTSTEELIIQLQSRILFDFEMDNPRDQVSIDVYLTNEVGEILFSANTSYFLELHRESDGEAVYYPPQNGLYFSFGFQGVRVPVSGVVSAKATSGDKDWVLEFNEDGIWIPSYFARHNVYKTLEVTFEDGQAQSYDWFGYKVEAQDVALSPGYMSFDGITKLEIFNGKVENTRLSNNSGWSSIIEISNPAEQEIEFNFREWNRAWSQPTHIHFHTIEGYKNGERPVVMDYSSGTDWTERNTKEYDLDAGNFFIILEWREDTQMPSQYQYNWNYYGYDEYEDTEDTGVIVYPTKR